MTDTTNTEGITPDGEFGPETEVLIPRPTPDDAEALDPIEAVEAPERAAKPEPVDYDSAPRIPLTEYKQGQEVAVWSDHDWRAGFIQGFQKTDGKITLIYVFTDRGPVTIMSDRGIRAR